jgi:hypothetical protein
MAPFIADTFHLKDTPVVETVAQKIRALFQGGRKWIKQDFVVYENHHAEPSGFCLIGALNHVRERDPDISPFDDPLYNALQRIVEERTRSDIEIADYNDHPDTRWLDISEVLDELHKRELAAR